MLASTAFAIHSTANRLKCYTLVQLIFFRDTILRVKHNAGWKLILQQNKAQINKSNTYDNIKRVYYN